MYRSGTDQYGASKSLLDPDLVPFRLCWPAGEGARVVPAATRFGDAFDAEDTALGAGGVEASIDEEGAGTAPETGVAEGRSAALAPDSGALGAELPSRETVDGLKSTALAATSNARAPTAA